MAPHSNLAMISLFYVLFAALTTFAPYMINLESTSINGLLIALSVNGSVVGPGKFTDESSLMDSAYNLSSNPHFDHLSFMLNTACKKSSTYDDNFIYLLTVLYTKVIISSLLIIYLKRASDSSKTIIKLLVNCTIMIILVTVCLDIHGIRTGDSAWLSTYAKSYTINGEGFVDKRFVGKFDGQKSFVDMLCTIYNMGYPLGDRYITLTKFSVNSIFDPFMLAGIVLKILSAAIMVCVSIISYVDHRKKFNIGLTDIIDYEKLIE